MAELIIFCKLLPPAAHSGHVMSPAGTEGVTCLQLLHTRVFHTNNTLHNSYTHRPGGKARGEFEILISAWGSCLFDKAALENQVTDTSTEIDTIGYYVYYTHTRTHHMFVEVSVIWIKILSTCYDNLPISKTDNGSTHGRPSQLIAISLKRSPYLHISYWKITAIWSGYMLLVCMSAPGFSKCRGGRAPHVKLIGAPHTHTRKPNTQEE